MGKYASDANNVAKRMESYTEEIEKMCKNIENCALNLEGDINEYANTYLSKYEEIVGSLRQYKAYLLDEYCQDLRVAGRKVDKEIEEEKLQQQLNEEL